MRNYLWSLPLLALVLAALVALALSGEPQPNSTATSDADHEQVACLADPQPPTPCQRARKGHGIFCSLTNSMALPWTTATGIRATGGVKKGAPTLEIMSSSGTSRVK